MVEIRQTTTEDLKDVQRLWADGDVMRFVGFPEGLRQTDEDMKDWYRWIEAGRPQLDHFSVFEDGAYCGEAFYGIDKEHGNSAALDIKLFGFARGRGIAAKALSFAIDKAFENGAKTVWVDPNPQNAKAIVLYEKLGFQRKDMPEHLLPEAGEPSSIYMELGLAEMLQKRNQKIINAVIAKARAVCPGALDLVGISGSFATGRIHARSDLDLLIVINDEAGQQLAAAFVQDDLQVGHDLYCVTWEKLGELARFESPHIAKLMESKIVWSAGKECEERLEALRGQAREALEAPFGEADLAKAEKYLREAEHCHALAQTAETLPDVRLWSAAMVYCLEDGLAMLNKRYYRLGVRCRFEELASLKNRPDDLCALIDGVAAAEDADELRKAATELLCRVTGTFRKARMALEPAKKTPGPGDLEGTWEEMVSNWRGKMRMAAGTGDRHLALMSLLSFRTMLEDEIGSAYEIGTYDVLAAYDPNDLDATASAFEALLARYKQTCEQAGVNLRQYENTEAFVEDYLRAEKEAQIDERGRED